VLICDESALFRRRLVLALERAADIEVVGEAPDADVARSAALQNAPDVVVLGHHLPPVGGVATAAALREANPVVALALVYDPDDEREQRELRRSFRVGVTAVMRRGSADADVVEVARSLVAGRPVLDPSGAGAVLTDFAQLGAASDSSVPPPSLEARERQVLEALAEGETVSDAAERLGLAPTTTANLVSNALRKLQRWARAAARARRADGQATPHR
jgi:DNA-binding NarL/FixJ family response regulator